MNKNKKITLQDVANYANVSAGTVDRVIHNRGKVSLDKRKLVEEAIKDLGFNPNSLASTLALGKTFTICTLLPESTTTDKYWSFPKIGAEKMGEEYSDFGFSIDAYGYSLFDESSFVKHAEAILEKKPSGVILAPLFEKESHSFLDALDEMNIPYVFIDANIPERKALSYIGPDSKSSGRVVGMLFHSILNSDEDILIVNMVKGFDNSSLVGVIEQGFLDFFSSKEGLNTRKITSLTINSTEKEDVYRELTKCYIKNPNIKGVFVTNSRAHLIATFNRDHELDIKVIGFDLIEENITELKNEGIRFLISQNPIFQGKWAVQAFFNFFVSRKSLKKIHHVPIDIIIKENVEFYMNAR